MIWTFAGHLIVYMVGFVAGYAVATFAFISRMCDAETERDARPREVQEIQRNQTVGVRPEGDLRVVHR